MRRGSDRRGRRQSGFTYLAVLFGVVIVGIGVSAAAMVWTRVSAAQKRAQFEWAGEQYRRAIASYVESDPHARSYPRTGDDLLEDRRGLTLRRHLRDLYGEPFAANGQWQWVRDADGGIAGVRGVWDDGMRRDATRDFVYAKDVGAAPSSGEAR
jgi:type II secretory pathway pseudopilin PulG